MKNLSYKKTRINIVLLMVIAMIIFAIFPKLFFVSLALLLAYILIRFIVSAYCKSESKNEVFEEKFEELIAKINEQDIEKIRKLEKSRWIERRVLVTFIIIISIACLSICIGVENLSETTKWAFILGELIIVGFLVTKMSTQTNQYNIQKLKVKKSLIEYIDNSLEFLEPADFSDYYKDAGFDNFGNEVLSEFYAKGKIKDRYEYLMANTMLWESEIKRHGNVHYYSYEDLLFAIDLHTTASEEGIFLKSTGVDRNLEISNNQIKVDNEEFERHFDVFCSNNDMANNLLTPNMMNILLDYSKEKYFDLTIKQNRIYLRLRNWHNDTSKTWKTNLYKDYKDIEFANRFMTDLTTIFD